MADWPINNAGANILTGGYTGSNSYLNVLTAHATAHTKGAYTELSSATPFTATGIILSVRYSDYPYSYLIDLAIGAAGSESAIINNILYHTSLYTRHAGVGDFFFPINIPKGVRLSARVQSSTGGKVIGLCAMLFSGGFAQSLSGVDTCGANVADSGATAVDPGATANTKGAWVELSAATLRTSHGMVLAFGGILNALMTWTEWRLDIGVGTAGSEQIILADYNLVCAGAGSDVSPKMSNFYPVSIPKGSRLTARAQCGINDATDRLFDIAAYLIY